ncbi:hypothetical protein JCM17380_23960 [Desulfosporosinus burensis]
MIWKLWSNKKNEMLAQMQELLTPINQHLTFINQQATDSSEQMVEMGDQLRKLGRLQYKSGQDVQGKLEGLSSRLETVQQWQEAYTIDKSRLDSLEQQIGQVSEMLLVWLDDLDLLSNSLREQGQDGWLKLLETWTSQVLQALQIHGVNEILVVGTSFDPKLAESIGTVVRQPVKANATEEDSLPVSLPYEVAEVVKRGFVNNDGILLRKAQVMTYQEDDHAEK